MVVPSSKRLLRPEYSAQGMKAGINPLAAGAITRVKEITLRPASVADQGCGLLRHLRLFVDHFAEVVAVDTPWQLERTVRLDGKKQTIAEYLASSRSQRMRNVRLMDSAAFCRSRLELDAAFSINTFDVVPPRTRGALMRSAARNLCTGGTYTVIIPRNDTTITSRCRKDNAYQDGHVFAHHGVSTFFKNFVDYESVIRLARRNGFKLADDLSVYRHVCVIFEKQ
jgi:SAM-dependent methyltransferase